MDIKKGRDFLISNVVSEKLNKFLMQKLVVYDSGIGGQAIFEKCRSFFSQSFYLADKKNFPYGNKTFNQLKIIFLSNLTKLNLKKGDLLVLACNTISCVYLKIKKDLNLDYEVLTILDFVLQEKPGLVLCTKYTSEYLDEINVLNKALPELASLIEMNKETDIISYLKNENIQKKQVIYGCTHYSIIDKIFKVIFPDKEFKNPEGNLVREIKRWISQINGKLIDGY